LAEYDKALYYLDKAEKKALLAKNYYTLGLILMNKGNVYAYGKNDSNKSRIYFQAALDTALSHKDIHIQQAALVNLGHLYLDIKDPQKALSYLKEANDLKGDVEAYYKNKTITLLGEAYLDLDNNKFAAYYLLQSLHTAQTLNIGVDKQEAYLKLAQFYKKTGQYKRAFEFQQAHELLSDSLQNQAISKNINQLEVKYRTAEKDKEIAQQENAIKEKNIWLTGVSAGALLLIALIGLLFSYNRINAHKQRLLESDIRMLQQEQQIGNLKAMMSGEEKERVRIARELHDGIGGMLVSVKLNLGSIKAEHPEIAHITRVDDVA